MLCCVANGGLSLLCQNDVGGVLRGNVLGAPITEAECVDVGEEVFAGAEECRGDRNVHLVDLHLRADVMLGVEAQRALLAPLQRTVKGASRYQRSPSAAHPKIQ